MSLRTEVVHNRNVVIVRLTGELDHHTSEDVRLKLDEVLLKENSHHMVMNLETLTFMDSSGIGVLLGRYKQLKNKGGKLILCHIDSPVHKLLELSGLFKIIDVYDDEVRALSSLEVVS